MPHNVYKLMFDTTPSHFPSQHYNIVQRIFSSQKLNNSSFTAAFILVVVTFFTKSDLNGRFEFWGEAGFLRLFLFV